MPWQDTYRTHGICLSLRASACLGHGQASASSCPQEHATASLSGDHKESEESNFEVSLRQANCSTLFPVEGGEWNLGSLLFMLRYGPKSQQYPNFKGAVSAFPWSLVCGLGMMDANLSPSHIRPQHTRLHTGQRGEFRGCKDSSVPVGVCGSM